MVTILRQRVPATPIALPTTRHATRDALIDAGIGQTLFDESIAVALSEAVGNAVRHAYPDHTGEIEVAVIQDDIGILVIVSDSGVGVDHPSDHPGLGLGLTLIDKLATTSTVDSAPSGTTVTMRFAQPGI